MAVNFNPTQEDILKALKEYSNNKNRYEWHGNHCGNGKGKNLWQALLDDAGYSSSQHWSIFDNWAFDEADERSKDTDYRKDVDADRKEPMTDQEWWDYCYSIACDDTFDMPRSFDFNAEEDNEVAEFFGIKYEITEYDCDNSNVTTENDVVAICDCGCPLSKNDLYSLEWQKPSCPYCGFDTRTTEEKIVCGI